MKSRSSLTTAPKRSCMHCERPFVFNDELRYFAHRHVDSLPCDICGETNYLIKESHKPGLWLISFLTACLSLIPLAGSVWFTYDIWTSSERVRLYILAGLLFIGFTMTTALLNVIYRNYIWQTRKLSKQFHSPFFDNLNR